MRLRPFVFVLLLPILAGCGDLYWQRPGGTVQDFERDSLPCVEEARGVRYGVGAEDLYHGCMKSKGWQRVQTPFPEPNQFRGPEEAEDILGPPPSPFGGPRTMRDTKPEIKESEIREIKEAELKALCQRPTAMRPTGIVCPAGNPWVRT